MNEPLEYGIVNKLQCASHAFDGEVAGRAVWFGELNGTPLNRLLRLDGPAGPPVGRMVESAARNGNWIGWRDGERRVASVDAIVHWLVAAGPCEHPGV